MDLIGQNVIKECEVCWNQSSIYIPLMICAHASDFCEKCMKTWFAEGHCTCPKCRKILPVRYYLEETNQSHLNIANVSLTRNLYAISNNRSIQQSLPNPRDRLISNVLACCSIALLLALVIYPTVQHKV